MVTVIGIIVVAIPLALAVVGLFVVAHRAKGRGRRRTFSSYGGDGGSWSVPYTGAEGGGHHGGHHGGGDGGGSSGCSGGSGCGGGGGGGCGGGSS